MANHQKYCYHCNRKLIEMADDGIIRTMGCKTCEFRLDIPTPQTNAERQAAYYLRKKTGSTKHMPPRKPMTRGDLPSIKKSEMNGNMVFCPYCQYHARHVEKDPAWRTAHPLTRVNLSDSVARKGCKTCKRKFEFIRTDTPEGRALRAKLWRNKTK